MNQAEFDDAMRAGELQIALVGMSNVGKTKAGRALQKTGNFEHFEIDADIRRSLGLTSWQTGSDCLAVMDILNAKKSILNLRKCIRLRRGIHRRISCLIRPGASCTSATKCDRKYETITWSCILTLV